MGKTRTAFIGDADAEAKLAQERRKKKEIKIAAKRAEKIRVPGLKGGERVTVVNAQVPDESAQDHTEPTQLRKGTPYEAKHGKRYMAKKARVENKSYPPIEAIKLAQKTSVGRFVGKIELHMSLAKKGRFEVNLPHPFEMGKKRIEITNDDTIEKLKKSTIDFDILIATPEYLPKLVPFARLLGPRGLMPNPKNGTIVADPKTALEKFSGGTLLLQTEKDVPVVHTLIGKVSDPANNVLKNFSAVVKTIGKQNIKKATVSSTMGPGVRISIQ